MRLLAVLGLVCVALCAAGQGEPPGVTDFFPYGVYIAGNGPNPADRTTPPEQKIERACADLEAHGFNCVWLKEATPRICSSAAFRLRQ